MKEFLDENFLSEKVLDEIKQIKYQLLQSLISLGFVIVDKRVDTKAKEDNIRKITGSQVRYFLLI